MGIPRFFYWLYHNYPEVLISLKKNKTFSDEGLGVDSYALDVNAIIHPVCQRMYNYGSKTNNNRLLHRKPQKLYVPSEKQVFSEICKVIDELRRIVKPKKQLIIAIDGVAGLGKIQQQRSRRFKSASERDEKQVFDSNKITTGSEFMYNFSHYMHVYIQRQLESNPEWQNLEVIFSNEKVSGEGEHKLLSFIKNNKNMSYCIHSPDADLIMLTIGLDIPNIYIVRENIYQDIDCQYFIVNVNSFRTILLRLLRWSSTEHEYNQNQTIYDFILLGFLLGNDFLPHIPSLEISNEGLELILEIYPRVATNNGHLVYRSKKTNELCINTKSLSQLFYSLSNKEKELLTRKAKENIKFPDTLLKASLNEIIDVDSKVIQTLDFNMYQKKYYEKRLHECEPYNVCTEYFKGLLFVIRYYIDEIPDWYWFYPFHYAPFFMDMYKYIEKFDGEMKFDRHIPLSSFEQLLAVLPQQSQDILPLACRHFLTSDESPIIDFYPLKFEIDLEGKRQEWEGHPILPFIDIDRLKKAYKSIEDKLIESEKKRTMEGKNIKYFNNGVVRTVFFKS